MEGLAMIGALDYRFAVALEGRCYPFDPYHDGRFANALGEFNQAAGLRRFAYAQFAGDLGQLPPVRDSPWYRTASSGVAEVGKRIVQSIMGFAWECATGR